MFNADRWIGIAGLIVGIPGFILLFISGDRAFAWLFAILIVVCVISVYLIYRAGQLPPFRMNKVRVVLRISDTLGSAATLRKEYEAVPSYGHLTEMSHRNIAADGALTNLKWNDAPIDSTWVKQVLGEYQIVARFPGPLACGKAFNCALSYDVLDSFLQSQEALVYVVDFPAKIVEILIQFPEDRMCSEADCFRVQGAGKTPLAKPILDPLQRTLSVKLKKPQVGAEIEVWWTW